VNGLALALDNKSSYLGISSITAVIRVIVQITPDAKTRILSGNAQSADPYQECPRAINEALLPDDVLCINTYFTHVHNSNPLVNEALFRSKYLSSPQNDSPWIALLNMVFTMGSIAVSDARNRAHFVFYRRANPHMTLESLGAGHLETVQAFAILGGSYLHYLNKPNLASVITGAALRMAVALGLHLEPAQKSEDLSDDARLQFETRRRTWWCLFCFDAWASATLGRRWFKNQISAWNAVWLLFQATMIPLLGLFSDPDHENVPKWRQSIEKSLSLFDEMRDFSLAAQRSCEVVARIYEASEKARTPPAGAQREVQSEWTWLEDQFWPCSKIRTGSLSRSMEMSHLIWASLQGPMIKAHIEKQQVQTLHSTRHPNKPSNPMYTY
jgi:hypothetical protein